MITKAPDNLYELVRCYDRLCEIVSALDDVAATQLACMPDDMADFIRVRYRLASDLVRLRKVILACDDPENLVKPLLAE